MKTKITLLTAIICVFFLIGCSSSELLVSLAAIHAAIESGSALYLSENTLSTSDKALFEASITAASAAVTKTADELLTADSKQTKLAKISSYFAEAGLTAAAAKLHDPKSAARLLAIDAATQAFLAVLAAQPAQMKPHESATLERMRYRY
jgi:hypothetical protein